MIMRSLARLGQLATLALAGMVLAGCASTIVNSYVGRGADFRQYRTYAWGPSEAFSTGDPRLDNNPFFDARVRASVEQQLARRGFEKMAAGTPDLLVHYHASVTQRIQARDLDPAYGYCEAADCGPYAYEAGTLLIDLVDPRTSQLVWRGWAERSIDGVIENQALMEKSVDEAVRRILDRLPAGL
jgi:hypothetical protein